MKKIIVITMLLTFIVSGCSKIEKEKFIIKTDDISIESLKTDDKGLTKANIIEENEQEETKPVYKEVENENEIEKTSSNNEKEINENIEKIKEENLIENIEEIKNKFPDEYTVMFSSTDLNIRKGPGVEFEKIGYYKTNDEVKTYETYNNGWVRVNYNEVEGFVNKKYLSKEKVEIQKNTINENINVNTNGLIFDGNVSQECKNKAVSLYGKVPENVKNTIVNTGYQVVISSNPSWTDGHAGTYYPTLWNGWQGRSICIYAGSVNKVNIAVIHEIGHFIDEYIGTRNGCSFNLFGYWGITSTSEWININNEESGL